MDFDFVVLLCLLGASSSILRDISRCGLSLLYPTLFTIDFLLKAFVWSLKNLLSRVKPYGLAFIGCIMLTMAFSCCNPSWRYCFFMAFHVDLVLLYMMP